MKVKKILCPVDFSAGSKQAMRWAVRLAIDFDAELVLLHAWQVPMAVGDYAFAPNVTVDIEDAARECLDKDLAAARSLGNVRVSAKLVCGPAWSMIVDELRDPSFDVAVMGKHGKTGLQRFLLGSVAEKVVRHASCPVLTVPPELEPHSFKRILVPVDFSDCARAATEAAAALVQPDGAGITLLHVIDLPVNYHGEPPIEGLMEMLDKRSSEALEAWSSELRSTVRVPVTTRSRIGRAGTEALAVLEEPPGYDLVVTGSHGRTGLSRVLLGSVAEKIVRHAPCPVLVVRRRNAS